MATPKPDITLYTASTPNGQKISITLEELNIPYSVQHIDISKNIQKEDWYLEINPNGRIPAIVDKISEGGEEGGEVKERRVFDGMAIMLYLCQRYDTHHQISFPFDTDEYWQTIQWITWLQSGIGPMQGQANHFYRYAPTKIDYAISRYQTETKRLYQVLETHLKSKSQKKEEAKEGPWIVGQKLSIADLACFSWINWAEWAGVSLDTFPELSHWLERINARPTIQRGLDIPVKFEMKEKMQSKEGEEAFAKYHSNWVMSGQEKDQKTHR